MFVTQSSQRHKTEEGFAVKGREHYLQVLVLLPPLSVALIFLGMALCSRNPQAASSQVWKEERQL